MIPLNLLPDVLHLHEQVQRFIACGLDRLRVPQLSKAIARAERCAEEYRTPRMNGESELTCLQSNSLAAVTAACSRSSFVSLWTVLTDLLGPTNLPYLPVNWREYNAGEIPRLAQSIYDYQAYGRLPELADVLLRADIRSSTLQEHLRNRKRHFRGCWVLDFLRGIMEKPRQSGLLLTPKVEPPSRYEVVDETAAAWYFANRARVIPLLLSRPAIGAPTLTPTAAYSARGMTIDWSDNLIITIVGDRVVVERELESHPEATDPLQPSWIPSLPVSVPSIGKDENWRQNGTVL